MTSSEKGEDTEACAAAEPPFLSRLSSTDLGTNSTADFELTLPPLVSSDSAIIGAYHARSQSLSNILSRVGVQNRPERIDTQVRNIIGDDLDITYHLLTADDLAIKFRTNLDKGLTEEESLLRRQVYGTNILTPPVQYHWSLRFMAGCLSGFGALLLWSAMLCFSSWLVFDDSHNYTNLILFVLLFFIIALQGIVNFYQESKTGQALVSIRQMMPETAEVVRDGVHKSVSTAELAVGDIVFMKAGQKVPADCRLLSVCNFQVDKSQLTGENEPVLCSATRTDVNYMHSRNIVFFGSVVIDGSSTGMVVEVGNRTVMGKIALLTGQTSRQRTLLQKDIKQFQRMILTLAVVTSVISIIAWFSWLHVSHPKFLSAKDLLLAMIGLTVALVPDGLPIAITVTLALMARKMARINVLVKSLPAVETLGAVSIIACDKTGTLTLNQMRVANICFGEDIMDAPTSKSRTDDPRMFALLQAAALCNGVTSETDRSNVEATDAAVYDYVNDIRSVVDIRQAHPLIGFCPFQTPNKFKVSVHEIDATHRVLYMTGAPEIILDHCSFSLNTNGQQIPLTNERRDWWTLQRQIPLAKKGERVIGLAQAMLPPQSNFHIDQFQMPSDGFTFIGLLSLMDPPRSAVTPAIQVCRTAGIKVVMITGDHPATAEAIATTCGIITMPIDLIPSTELLEHTPAQHRAVIVNGSDLTTFNGRAWDWVFGHQEIVFARTSPDQKLQIVQEGQKRGHVVAVTGDGVNDAPALKQADVGVAMGSGHAVSKDAAHLILLDDNFASLVHGIEMGRLVFDNLKKVVLFLLPAGTFAELLPLLAHFFLGTPLPMSPFLMIIVCMCTDILPSMALIYQQVESPLMLRPPRNERLVDRRMLFFAYLYLGLLEASSAFIAFLWYLSDQGISPGEVFFAYEYWDAEHLGLPQAELDNILNTGQSVYFLTLVIVQFGALLALRTRYTPTLNHNPFSIQAAKRNAHMVAYGALSSLSAVLVICLPVFNDSFGTRWVPVKYLAPGFGFGGFIFLSDELRKYWSLKFPNSLISGAGW